MLKFLVLLLLVINAGLLGYQQLYRTSFAPEEHEPTRLSQQFNVDQVQLLPADAADTAADPEPAPEAEKAVGAPARAEEEPAPAPDPMTEADRADPAQVAGNPATSATPSAAPAPAPAAPAVPVLACLEVSRLTPAAARTLEAQLARQGVNLQPRRQEVTEASSHMVLYPAQGSRAQAEQRAAELRQAGVTELYVLGASSAHPWGISLGVFRTEEAARVQLANLALKGVQGATLVPHTMALKHVALQFPQVDEATRARISQLAARLADARIAACS